MKEKTALIEKESGNKVTTITLLVPRSYKNLNGEYDADILTCTLWNGVAENTFEYCKKGDLLSIRGRVARLDKTNEMQIIVERVIFLSSRKED